jgi:hypothetical protein
MKRPVVGALLAVAPRWPRASYYKRMKLFTKIFSGKIFVYDTDVQTMEGATGCGPDEVYRHAKMLRI